MSPTVSVEQPHEIKDGKLTALAYSENAGELAAYESGQYLMIPLSLRVVDIEPFLQVCRTTLRSQVKIYRADVLGRLLFRGSRELLQASASSDGIGAYAVFGGASDDLGRRYRAIKSGQNATMLAVPSGRTLLLALPRASIEAESLLSVEVKEVAKLPSTERPAASQGLFPEAQKRLFAVESDARNWPSFADWLARRKPTISQRQLESVLRMAINTPGCDGIEVLLLSRELMAESSELTDAGFARDACITAGTVSGEIDPIWAEMLVSSGRTHFPDDRDVLLATARIRLTQGNYEAAAHHFLRALDGGEARPTPDDLTNLLVAVLLQWPGKKAVRERAVKLAEDTLSAQTRPRDRWNYHESLGYLVDIAKLQKAGFRECVERILWTAVDSGEDTSAMHFCDLYLRVGDFSFEDKLKILSIVEGCENLQQVLSLYQDVVSRHAESSRLDLIDRAIEQIRFVEYLIGDAGNDTSEYFVSLAKARRAKLRESERRVAPQEQSFEGLTITLLGGQKRIRARVTTALEGHGARVREVPPSWELQLDERSVLRQVRGADLVALIADEVGHDIQSILRQNRVDFLFAEGGPSRIVRALAEGLRSRLTSG